MRSISIAPPAEHVREDEPLAYRSRGSHRAAALEQLALHPDHLRGLQAQRGEAQGESRLTTEDWRRGREGLWFDGALPRTSRSLTWMKPEVPTPLKTDLDVETDSAVGPRAPSTPRRSARYAIQQGWSADPSFEFCTARRRSWLCRTLVRQLAATTAGFYKRSAISGSSRTIPANLSPDSHPLPSAVRQTCVRGAHNY